MFVSLSGGGKKEQHIVEQVICFCIKALIPRAKKLDIDVKIKKNLDAYGYCMMEDTNREFTISLRKGMSVFDLVSTVCHEMVHLKQYYRSELDYCCLRGTKWKSKFFKDDCSFPPWEKEAYKLEKTLAYKFLEEVDVKV